MSAKEYWQLQSCIVLFLTLVWSYSFWQASLPPKVQRPLIVGVPFSPQLDHAAVIAQAQAAIQWFDLPNGHCLYVTSYDGWSIAKSDLGLPVSAPCP